MTLPSLSEIFDIADLGGLGVAAEASSGAAARDFTGAGATAAPGGPVLSFAADEFNFGQETSAASPGAAFDTDAGAGSGGVTIAEAGKGGNGGGGGGGGGGKPDKGGGDPPEPTTPITEYTSGAADVFTDGAKTTDNFNIHIIFEGIENWDGNLQAAFTAAADYLSSIIATGLADHDQSFTYGVDGIVGLEGVFQPVTPYDMVGDDIVIEAHLLEIDGVGGIAGGAAPYQILTGDGSFQDVPDGGGVYTYDALPSASLMVFDSADAYSLLADGTWDDVVLHEMLHALGFGTVWGEATTASSGLNWDVVDYSTTTTDRNGTGRPNDDTVYYDYTGTAWYDANPTGDTLRVEAQPFSPSAGSHWDELSYGDEIMTGTIDGSSTVADFTIAALADLGYQLVSADYETLAAEANAILIA